MSRTIEGIKKAFHEARIVGEQKMQNNEITWDQFQFVMVGFELQLQELGVIL